MPRIAHVADESGFCFGASQGAVFNDDDAVRDEGLYAAGGVSQLTSTPAALRVSQECRHSGDNRIPE